MSKLLVFLDDVRDPKMAYDYTGEILYFTSPWNVVRSVEDFKKAIEDLYEEEGRAPNIISFDHDLEEAHYQYLKNPIPYNRFETPTGYHAAMWFKDFVKKHNLIMPEVLCHSMNPDGKSNILDLFDDKKKR